MPGLTLNLGKNGISTTIGGRGASINIGGRGTYMNLGVPGTGMSYRQRLGSSSHDRSMPTTAEYEPQIEHPELNEVGSAELDVLTTPGMEPLLQQLRQWVLYRKSLQTDLASAQKALRWHTTLTTLLRVVLIGFLPAIAQKRAAGRAELEQEIELLQEALAQQKQKFDFVLDEEQQAAYQQLCSAFEKASCTEMIWDKTRSGRDDQGAEHVVKLPVWLSQLEPKHLTCSEPIWQLDNHNGAVLYFMPGFLYLEDEDHDKFAMVGYDELEIDFITALEHVSTTPPADAEVMGQRWLHARTDGSPDRRYKNNVCFTVLKLGQLTFTSKSGLHEAYIFSNYAAAAQLAKALNRYKAEVQSAAAAM